MGEFCNNEVQMMRKFNEFGGHRNIVPILRHGWIAKKLHLLHWQGILPNDLGRFHSSKIQFYCWKYLFLRFTATSSSSPPCIDIVGIMQDVTASLNFIHSLNAIHRDIKPKNDSYWLCGALTVSASFTMPRCAANSQLWPYPRGSFRNFHCYWTKPGLRKISRARNGKGTVRCISTNGLICFGLHTVWGHHR